ETGELRELDDGAFACPICGEPWPYPPYSPNDGALGQLHDISTPAFGDVCNGCGVEFGVDEGVPPYARIGAQYQQWAEFRLKWLHRRGWRAQGPPQVGGGLWRVGGEMRQ